MNKECVSLNLFFVLFRKKAKGTCVSDVCYSFPCGKEKGNRYLRYAKLIFQAKTNGNHSKKSTKLSDEVNYTQDSLK